MTADFNVERLLTVIDRMNEAISRLNEVFITLSSRINDLEVKLDNLRVEFDHHAHPAPAPKKQTDPEHPLIAKPGHQANP